MIIDAGNASVVNFIFGCLSVQLREGENITDINLMFYLRFYTYHWLTLTLTLIMRTKDWITPVFIEIIWVLIRNYSHQFEWCNCPQQGSLLRLKSSSKQVTHVDKTCKTQNKTHMLHHMKMGVVSSQSGCRYQ